MHFAGFSSVTTKIKCNLKESNPTCNKAELRPTLKDSFDPNVEI